MLSRFSDVLQATADVLAPPATRYEDFQYHWKMIINFYQNYDDNSKVHIEDTRVPHHLHQMLQLIVDEEKEEQDGTVGPCLESVIQRSIPVLDALAVLAVADRPPGARAMALTLATALLRRTKRPCINSAHVYRPIQRMLVQCNECPASPTEKEEVELLLTLCGLVRKEPGLANIFTTPFVEDKSTLLSIPEDIKKLIPIKRKTHTPKKNPLFEVDMAPNPMRNVSIVRDKDDCTSNASVISGLEDNGSCKSQKTVYDDNDKFLLIDLLLSYLNSADNQVVLRACEGIMIVSSLPEDDIANLVTSSPACEVIVDKLLARYRSIPYNLDPNDVDHLNITWAYVAQDFGDKAYNRFNGYRELTSFFSWLDYCDTLMKECHPTIACHLARMFRAQFLEGAAEALLVSDSTESLLPATESRVPATESRVPATESRVSATESLLPTTESRVPATESRVSATELLIPATESLVPATESRVPATESRVSATESLLPAVARVSAKRAALTAAVLAKCLRVVDSPDLINEFSNWLVGDGEVCEWPLLRSLIDNCLTTNHDLTLETLRFFEAVIEKGTEHSMDRLVLARVSSRGYCAVGPAPRAPSPLQEERDRLNDVSYGRERERNREAMRQLQHEEHVSEQVGDILHHEGLDRQDSGDNIHRVINSFLLLLPRAILSDPVGTDYENYIHDAQKHYQLWLDLTSTYNWPTEVTYIDNTASSTHSYDSRPEADIHMDDVFDNRIEIDSYRKIDYSFVNRSSLGEDEFDEGPFFRMLFKLLGNMPDQPYQVNLHLTSIISKLALLPHPNLHEYLLNPNLQTARKTQTLFKVLQDVARRLTMEIPRLKNYKKVIENTRLELMSEDPSYDERNDHNQLVESLIVLEEFCKELAAIAFVKYQHVMHMHR